MLKEYLRSVQAWIEQGCPESGVYSHGFGLCRNTFRFMPNSYEETDKLRMELEDAFIADGLDPEYPFNSAASYETECFLQSVWENPKRLEWVKKHAETLP